MQQSWVACPRVPGEPVVVGTTEACEAIAEISTFLKDKHTFYMKDQTCSG